MRALVIGTLVVMACACAQGLDSERRAASSSSGPPRGDDSASSARVMRFAPPERMPAPELMLTRVDAGESRDVSDDAGEDTDTDTDAGADSGTSEFERAIVYDCTETVMCTGPANTIPQCVVSVRQALTAATPEQRQVFMEHVARCRPQRACEYVDCARSKTP